VNRAPVHLKFKDYNWDPHVVLSLSAVNGIYQNTVYGIAAKLPFKYTGAVVLGSVRNRDEELLLFR
jgi:hypothetical protein